MSAPTRSASSCPRTLRLPSTVAGRRVRVLVATLGVPGTAGVPGSKLAGGGRGARAGRGGGLEAGGRARRAGDGRRPGVEPADAAALGGGIHAALGGRACESRGR